jgi:hypothetical protein
MNFNLLRHIADCVSEIWQDLSGHLRQVVRIAALVCFWAGVAFGFYWLTYRTPEEIKIDEQRAADAAQKAKEQSDDTDRQTYAQELAKPDVFKEALEQCRALQIKYRLAGSAEYCARWELARQVEEASVDASITAEPPSPYP